MPTGFGVHGRTTGVGDKLSPAPSTSPTIHEAIDFGAGIIINPAALSFTSIAVLDALAPDQRDPKIMNWRIEAKMAQASLLSRSIFNDDTADADWAYRQAQTLVSACNSLILG